MSNRDNKKVKSLVERWFEIENEFNEAKTERNDMVKDLKAEIKSRVDETGCTVAEIQRLVAIRLAEAEARENLETMTNDLDAYEVIFGSATRAPAQDDDEV
jgi:Fe-S cluster assembly scaffold protein SufB